MRTRQYIRVKPFELNVRQQRFVEEYLVDLDGPKAAIRGGYKPEGAYMQAHRLLNNVKVKAAIQRAMNLRSQRVEISQDQTIQEIARGCFWDVANMFSADGSLKDIRDMDFDTRKAIAGFEHITLYEGEGEQKHAFGRLNKIKLVDRRAYLELLGRHQKLFTDVIQHELGPELVRILGGGIDFSKLNDQELAEFNAAIAGLVRSGGNQRSLPEKSAVLAEPPHSDS